MPIVTVWPTPNGLPTASTKSPTCRWLELPIGTAVRFSRRNLQHGDVGGRVAPDQLGLEVALVLGGDFDVGGVLDDVVVGQHVALRGIDDDAGAHRLGFALDRLVAEVEKLAEQRVLRQRVVLAHLALDRDADNARGDAADHVGDARHRRAVARFGYRRAGQRRMRQRRRQRDPGRYNERRQCPVHVVNAFAARASANAAPTVWFPEECI